MISWRRHQSEGPHHLKDHKYSRVAVVCKEIANSVRCIHLAGHFGKERRFCSQMVLGFLFDHVAMVCSLSTRNLRQLGYADPSSAVCITIVTHHNSRIEKKKWKMPNRFAQFDWLFKCSSSFISRSHLPPGER